MQKLNIVFKWVAAAICAAALVLSLLLMLQSARVDSLIGCSAGSGCDTVLGSRWSRLFSLVPVAAFGLGAYSVLLVLILFADGLEDEALAARMRLLGLVLAGSAGGAAIWFIYVQHRYIGAFCPYCMCVHCLGLLLGAILLLRHCLTRPLKTAAGAYAVGLCLAGAFALTQYLTTPRYAYDSGRAEEELPDLSALGLPVIGRADADAKVMLLYDYRCSHCRKLHGWLEEIPALLAQEGESVSFVLCPVPLSKECNPYVSSDVDLFAGSCTLDKCALAVWRRDAGAFREMDDFLFGQDAFPRSEEECRGRAASLIGADALEEELHSEWMRTYLSAAFELFGRTSQGKAAVPRFVYGGRYIVPDADSAPDLVRLLKDFIEAE